MPQTSTKRRAEPKDDLLVAEETGSAVERARRRIAQGYYNRPEVRRTLASLILHRAAQNTLRTS